MYYWNWREKNFDHKNMAPKTKGKVAQKLLIFFNILPSQFFSSFSSLRKILD
jgi:hypothetical protein